MSFGLDSVARLSDEETRSISPENPNGASGGGARADPGDSGPASRLGPGWKVRPFISLAAGELAELAVIEGPATIRHIWLTVDPAAYRGCILRIQWDEEPGASVEVPLGDFFANGHGMRCNINSIPVAVNPDGGFNSYWPMPFRASCRITVENQTPNTIDGLFYQVSYSLGAVADDAAYFHAQWRRSVTEREHPEHTLLDATGRGHYVGTYIAWSQLSDGWWGEGELKFFIDSDTTHPTICTTGTEDYIGGAWGFGDTFSGPFLGYPLQMREAGRVPKHGMYRWHIPDPIRFRERLRVTVQALGWWPDGTFQPLADDVASVAYWYQTEPHAPFPAMLPLIERYPR
jgi:hypothetical protein